MKVLVCGGRDYRNTAYLFRALDKLHQERPITELIQGGANGADALAREWAKTKPDVARFVCKANWQKYGKAAGPIRNSKMLAWGPDLVIAFPTPKSRGTWDMVRKAKAAGVETIVEE